MLAEIVAWFNDGDYTSGVELYKKYGTNNSLKGLFSIGPNSYNKLKLQEELSELRSLFHEKEKEAVLSNELEKNSATPQVKLPFNRAGAPDILIKIENEKASHFKKMAFLHGQLRFLTSDEERFEHAKSIITLESEVDVCWKYLDFWTHNKKIHPELMDGKNDLETMSPIELLKHRNNIRSRMSKNKNKSHRAADMLIWENELKEVEGRLNGA